VQFRASWISLKLCGPGTLLEDRLLITFVT
jgi:hypothetical protein